MKKFLKEYKEQIKLYRKETGFKLLDSLKELVTLDMLGVRVNPTEKEKVYFLKGELMDYGLI